VGYAAAAPAAERVHLEAHRRFAERVVALRTDARAGRPGANAALLDFLKAWLVDHIMTADRSLGEFVAAHRAGPGSCGVKE
jgi:hemerythrin